MANGQRPNIGAEELNDAVLHDEKIVKRRTGTITHQHIECWNGFQNLFFVRTNRLGRRLPDVLGGNDKPITGPWRWNNKEYKRIDYQSLNTQVIAQHLSGKLTDDWGERVQVQTYAVNLDGTSVFTTIDLDVKGEAHADVPEHFDCQELALAAAKKLIVLAEALGPQAHLEITKSGGYRVWIFHHRCPWTHAKDLGRLLLARANLNPKIEVFPKTAPAGKDNFGTAVFVPYWGINARRGRQVMLDPDTEHPLSVEEFVADALANRTSAETLEEIVTAATHLGEITETSARPERSPGRTGNEDNPFVDGEVAAQCWQAQLTGCEALREMVQRCEDENELSRAEWMRLATHLKQYGDWGLAEFHRLSSFDPHYMEHETDMMFDSLLYGPTTCAKMECGRDPQAECGMAEGKVSASWFAYQNFKLLPMISSAARSAKQIHRSVASNDGGDEMPPLFTSAGRAPLKQDWTADDCQPDPIGPWNSEGGRIWHTKEMKRDGPITTLVLGQLIQVTECARDLEDGSEFVTVRWSEGFAWREATVPRRTVSDARAILALADRGLMVTSENAKMLVGYLAHLLDFQQDNVPITWITQSCGHKTVEGQHVFVLGNQVIGGDDTFPSVKIAPEADAENFLSALGPSSAEGHREKARRWVTLATSLGQHPMAAFTLGAGFLAPLLGDLKMQQNPIIDIAGRSSSGKTTQKRLIASIWGLPPEVQGGLIRSWNSTPVFIERLASLCQDLPIFLDESHNARPEVVQNIIYQYGNGTGRGRGNRDGGVQRVARYRGVMFSAGEARLADVSAHDGTQARILGFWGSPYGPKQGELVKEIAAVSDECYGVVGPAFVTAYLMQHETYRTDLRRWHAEAAARLGAADDDGVGERLVGVCGAVEAAMRLACEITGITWDVTAIVDAAFALLRGNRKMDSAQASMELIGSWAAGHRGMFWSDEREMIEAKQPFDTQEPRELYGEIRTTLDGSEMFCILPEALKRVLEQHKHNYHTALAHWRDRGWIDTDGDKRLTRKVKLKGSATNMIQLSAEGMSIAFGAGDTLETIEDRTEQERVDRVRAEIKARPAPRD